MKPSMSAPRSHRPPLRHLRPGLARGCPTATNGERRCWHAGGPWAGSGTRRGAGARGAGRGGVGPVGGDLVRGMSAAWRALRALRLRLLGPGKELVGTDQFGNKYFRVPQHETRAGRPGGRRGLAGRRQLEPDARAERCLPGGARLVPALLLPAVSQAVRRWRRLAGGEGGRLVSGGRVAAAGGRWAGPFCATRLFLMRPVLSWADFRAETPLCTRKAAISKLTLLNNLEHFWICF